MTVLGDFEHFDITIYYEGGAQSTIKKADRENTAIIMNNFLNFKRRWWKSCYFYCSDPGGAIIVNMEKACTIRVEGRTETETT